MGVVFCFCFFVLLLNYDASPPVTLSRHLSYCAPITPSISHRSRFIMPTTRSNAPVNRSGLQRGSRHEAPKRKRSNADEHARKRVKDSDDVDEEGGELKVKGGRGGKKVRGKKKRSHLRFVPIPQWLRHY